MQLYIFAKVIVAVFLLSSTKQLRQILSSLEIIGYYLILSSYNHILSNIISVNKELIGLPKELLKFFAVELDRLVIVPFLTLWLLYYFSRLNNKPLLKFLLIIVWASVKFAVEFSNKYFHITVWNNWSLFLSYTISFYELVFIAAVTILLRSLLRKEGLLKC